MNQKEAWNKFKNSGSVMDYLAYKEVKRSEEDDHQSRRDDC